MKNLSLLLMVGFACNIGVLENLYAAEIKSGLDGLMTQTGGIHTANSSVAIKSMPVSAKPNKTKQPSVIAVYDDSELSYSVNLRAKVKEPIPVKLSWQLTTVERRVLAGGWIVPLPGNRLTIPLTFAKLKPGIKLKCLLLIKFNQTILVKQPIIIYSRQIFAAIAGQLKKLGAGAILPEAEIARLNKLGLGLPEKALAGFENPANEVIFCAAKEYADSIGMLQELMQRGVTLVMFAPENESEIFVPRKNMEKTTIISANNAKINGRLGVIYSKEKIVIGCDSGQASLINIKYRYGKIIIVAAAVYKSLTKKPAAALILKQQLMRE